MDILEFWKTAQSALLKTLEVDLGPPVLKIKEGKGTIAFKFQGKTLSFNLLVMPQITHNMLPFLSQVAEAGKKTQSKSTFILSKMIYPRIGSKLIELDISFLDTAGNVFIKDGDSFLMQLNQKSGVSAKAEHKSRLFAESGLKLLFAALQNPEVLNMTYREMAAASSISAASATILVRELLASKYLFESSNKRILVHKKELLDRWASAYQDILKPKIRLGVYQSLLPNLLKEFRSLKPQNWDARWSGEAAANLYTNYLSPVVLSLFVTQRDKKWISGLKLLPSTEKQHVEVYKIFWNPAHHAFENVKQLPEAVAPILVYAELITSNDSRKIETAQRIFDEYIQFTD